MGPAQPLTPRVSRQSTIVYRDTRGMPSVHHQYQHEVVQPQLQMMTPPTVPKGRSTPNPSGIRLTYHQPTGYERSPPTYQNQLTPTYEVLNEKHNPLHYYDEVMNATDPHEPYEDHQLDRTIYDPSRQLT